MKPQIALILLLAQLGATANTGQQRINLAGTWSCLLMEGGGQAQAVVLPGTTDTHRMGTPCTDKRETTSLSRLFSYKGKARYSRDIEIPRAWKGKPVALFLERTKPTAVFVDGRKTSESNDISTAQRHCLGVLSPGRHALVIEVDNASGVPEQLYASSHAYSESTQTNWNGIIGQLYLEVAGGIRMENLQVFTVNKDRALHIKGRLEGNLKGNTALTLTLSAQAAGRSHRAAVFNLKDKMDAGNNIDAVLRPGDDFLVEPWSEFHPTLYRVSITADGQPIASRTIGFIDFEARGRHFYVNSHITFLRGKHDACVWPMTGHVPMDTASWTSYLKTCKDYGINHIRFHSWCPPEAAFAAADELGIYMQPELPFWGDFNDKDTLLMSFLHKEGMNILRQYGHHPSFVAFALGNELWGSIGEMGCFVSDFRKAAPKKLYTFGSNYYLGYQGVKPGMDFFTTCRVGGEGWGRFTTHTRGSFSFADAYNGGILNTERPNTRRTLDEGCSLSEVPVVSHETGQFQTYPDYDEMAKYRGVLYPYNMEVFRQLLDSAGLLAQAKDFHRASGLWSKQLYKADIELDLRTRGMAGFQLLDLQDYPGQGSAYVGLLDAFMESKGLTTPGEWRQWCCEVVPLLKLPSHTFYSGESVVLDIDIANYSEHPLTGRTLAWRLVPAAAGAPASEGKLEIPGDSTGLFHAGRLPLRLPSTAQAQRMDITLEIEGTPYKNTWPLWLYPAPADGKSTGNDDIIVTGVMTDEIGKKLQLGARVLWMPDSAQLMRNTVAPLFQTDYWNWRMFKTISEGNGRPVSPGTLGLLCHPQHAVFRHFPTDSCTSWQWFDVLKDARPVILDRLPRSYRPLVQVVDNVERNHKLGLVCEFRVGKGALIVFPYRRRLTAPGSAVAGNGRNTAPEFLNSILRYMGSADFNPAFSITLPELLKALTAGTEERKTKELHNISQY